MPASEFQRIIRDMGVMGDTCAWGGRGDGGHRSWATHRVRVAGDTQWLSLGRSAWEGRSCLHVRPWPPCTVNADKGSSMCTMAHAPPDASPPRAAPPRKCIRPGAGTIGVSKEGIRFTVKGDLGTGNVLRKQVRSAKRGGGGGVAGRDSGCGYVGSPTPSPHVNDKLYLSARRIGISHQPECCWRVSTWGLTWPPQLRPRCFHALPAHSTRPTRMRIRR